MKKLDIIKFVTYTVLLFCLSALTVNAEETRVIDDFNGEDYSVVWSGGEFVSELKFSDGCLEVVGERSDSTELKAVAGQFSWTYRVCMPSPA